MADESTREIILSHMGPAPLTILELAKMTGLEASVISRSIGLAADAGECVRVDVPNPKHEKGSRNIRTTCKGYMANGSEIHSPEPVVDAPPNTPRNPEPEPLPISKHNPRPRRWISVFSSDSCLCDSLDEARDAARNLLLGKIPMLDSDERETLRAVVAEVIDIGQVSVRWEGE